MDRIGNSPFFDAVFSVLTAGSVGGSIVTVVVSGSVGAIGHTSSCSLHENV